MQLSGEVRAFLRGQRAESKQVLAEKLMGTKLAYEVLGKPFNRRAYVESMCILTNHRVPKEVDPVKRPGPVVVVQKHW
jgi:hypothetical protein